MKTDLANLLALRELSAAVQALENPYDRLPEVKNKDGEVITDVKDKRIALARQHIQAAGEIINLVAQVEDNASRAVEIAMVTKYQGNLKSVLAEQGASPELLNEIDRAVDMARTGQCDCESCRKQREQHKDKEEEPARQFGFGALMRRSKPLPPPEGK